MVDTNQTKIPFKRSRASIHEDALKKAISIPRCTLAVSVGVGKTLITYKYIYRFYSRRPRVLVVIPNISVIQSWKDEAIKFKCGHLFKLIKFTTYLSLHKQNYNYDLLILDEVHSLLYTHDQWLSGWKGRILGLTGTPPNDPKSEKGIMMARYCPVAYTYILENAVGDGILNDYRIVIHTIKLSQEEDIEVTYIDKKTKKEKTFFTSEAKSYRHLTRKIARSGGDADKRKTAIILRMTALKDFRSKEDYTRELLKTIPDKCIVFANTKEQASRICRYVYYSGNPNSERNLQLFQQGNILQISAINQLNQGINIKNLRAGIILYTHSKDSTKFMQRLGRLVRLNPKEMATCHILVYADTIEATHIADAISRVPKNKISYVN